MENIQMLDYFKSLNGDILNDIKAMFKEEVHKAGENIFLEGDKSKGIYFVTEGAVKQKNPRTAGNKFLNLFTQGIRLTT